MSENDELSVDLIEEDEFEKFIQNQKDDKKIQCLQAEYDNLKATVENYISKLDTEDPKVIHTSKLFLDWLKVKTDLVSQEKEFRKPDKIDIRRGSVVWLDFGFNVGEEFGGKHPAIILRVSGKLVFAAPLSSQKPKKPDGDMYVKLGPDDVKRFKKIERWVNILNIVPVSMQRIDFSNYPGYVNGTVLDNISKAIRKAGLN